MTHRRILLPVVGVVMAGIAVLLNALALSAQDNLPEPTGDDSYCLVCHAQENQSYTLPDGTVLDLYVNPQTLADSVHGSSNPQGALGCVDCHGNNVFPHDAPPPANARIHTIENSLNCTSCHESHAEELAPSVHYTAIVAGNLRAATCVDCHGGHAVVPVVEETKLSITQNCATCHTATYAEYQESVHGEALLAGDPNVPGCLDCHGVHGIQHPTTALFRNRSPQLCATCHADADLMSEYGISTNVFDSYLSDFHGTTVALFEQQDPNVASNKAVCYDCHGVHDIKRADDQKSQVVRANLLATCQQCHPSATSDFPDSWVGHFPPTPDDHPILFLVDQFYTLLIPTVVVGILGFIATDIFRRFRKLFQRSKG